MIESMSRRPNPGVTRERAAPPTGEQALGRGATSSHPLAPRPRAPRLRPPRAPPDPAYPSLREHLASRRTFLSALGASLLTSTLTKCVGHTPGAYTPPDPAAVRRIPAAGQLDATLRDGASCRFSIALIVSLDDVFPQIEAVAAALEVMEAHTAADLTAPDGIPTAEYALRGAIEPLVVSITSLQLTITALDPPPLESPA